MRPIVQHIDQEGSSGVDVDRFANRPDVGIRCQLLVQLIAREWPGETGKRIRLWALKHCRTILLHPNSITTQAGPTLRTPPALNYYGVCGTILGVVPAFLQRRLGESRVEPFVFTLPSKSRLGYTLIAVAGTGRLTLYRPLDDEQARHRGRLLRELETARYELKGMETLSFSVPTREGHDDELMSLAGYPLAGVAYAAATALPPPVSQVIPPEEDYRPHTGDDRARVW